ncbi:MAG: 3-phosphoshikimate 1-carboxyvinyltransferase [Lysobacterales bacterium]
MTASISPSAFLCYPATVPLGGETQVPGDKSISHRAMMFGCLASGVTTVTGLLEAADVHATEVAMKALGGQVARGDELITITGAGSVGLHSAAQPLDMGNSGTAMRLLAGLLAGQGIEGTLIGDESLSGRPMGRIIRPLRKMGVAIEAAEGDCAPLTIASGASLAGLTYEMPVASAQLKSCLLLAGLGCNGEVRIREPAPSRDHTETLLRAYGVEVQQMADESGQWLVMKGNQRLRGPVHIDVPGDFSSAAFFLVAASIVPDSDIILRNVGMNPVRTGLLSLLLSMGANITQINPRQSGGEQVADLRVRYAPLTGVDVDPALVPLMIDEFPILFVAAALSQGRTRVRGAEELRVKESDRIGVMAAGLSAMGVKIAERPDGLDIEGCDQLQAAQVHGRHDHRCAMSFSVAALRANGPVGVNSVENVATSFPAFRETLDALGGHIELVDKIPAHLS